MGLNSVIPSPSFAHVGTRKNDRSAASVRDNLSIVILVAALNAI